MKLILIVLLAVSLPAIGLAAGWKEISPKRVYDLLKEGSGLWLIDVRGEAAFERAHIEGAVNIPAAALGGKRFPPQKLLVVADNSLGGLQAREAAEVLVKNGHQRVFVLDGGIGAWRREGLPMVGASEAWELAQVMPGELKAAIEAGVKVEILDLREEEERQRTPLAEARSVSGKDLAERLERVKAEFGKSGTKDLAKQLRGEKPIVLILPTGVDARVLYQQHLWHLPGDVRVVEGGYLAGADLRQRRTVSNAEGCATCPGN